jgi:hypothetical protein
VPAWKNISLPQQQAAAIAANQASLPAAEALVSSTNQFSQSQVQKMLEAAIPGYSSMSATASSDIESFLKGEIPSDVTAQIEESTAAAALGGGYGGSGAATNLTARSLGLTSLDIMNRGLTSAQNWMTTMNSIFAPSELNVSSMFISPQQMFQDTFQNQEAAWNVQWLKNQIAAMPDPLMEAVGQLVGGIADTAVATVAGYIGGQGAASQVAGNQGGGGGGGSNLVGGSMNIDTSSMSGGSGMMSLMGSGGGGGMAGLML